MQINIRDLCSSAFLTTKTLPGDLVVFFRITTTWGSVIILEMLLFVIIASMPFKHKSDSKILYVSYGRTCGTMAVLELVLHLVARRRKILKHTN